MRKFAERLKEIRLEKNVTRKFLALNLEVSERLISYWENDERECSFEMRIKMADFFDVSIDYLLGRTEY